MNALLMAVEDTGGTPFADPAFWLNLGVAGAFLVAFAAGKIHPQSTIDTLHSNTQVAINKLEQERDRLLQERDRALAERDEMIEVMKNFTHTASAILSVDRQARLSLPKLRPGGDT